MQKTQKISNIGTVDFTNVTLMDTMEIYVDISKLSDTLKNDVDNAISKGKIKFLNDYKKTADLYKWNWSDKGVATSPQLHIILRKDGNIEYELAIFYEDLENEDLCDSVYITIEEMEHEQELKKLILNAMINKFF